MKDNAEIKAWIEDEVDPEEGVVIFENPDFSTAFVGVTTDNRAVYDLELMVEDLMHKERMTEEDAREFIDYNTLRSLAYVDNGPIVIAHSARDIL